MVTEKKNEVLRCKANKAQAGLILKTKKNYKVTNTVHKYARHVIFTSN